MNGIMYLRLFMMQFAKSFYDMIKIIITIKKSKERPQENSKAYVNTTIVKIN